ncbi:carbohydrate porin [Flavobacteriaceae bacterium]|nr:carbohydrate porin [Flavobacteriaceae bacterium]MDB4255787.1 carbohydrate porin [Flavobacteriaceae bacterium]
MSSNTFLFLFFLCLLSGSLVSAQSSNKETVFEGVYTLDLASNLKGGLDQGSAYLGNIDLMFTFDTEKFGFWKNGRFFVYLLNNHGNSLSDLIGDFQVVNNIEANPNSRLYEFWYEHHLENIKITIGQHNLNSIFAISKSGLFFINSSFGIQPDISANVSTSIFPLAALGAIISLKINSNLQFNNGVYDGDPGSETSNPNSLKWSLNKTDGAFFIHELVYEKKKDSSVNSIFKLGLWNHIQKQIFDGFEQYNSQGIYFIGEKKIFQLEDDVKRVNFFTQVGFSLNQYNPVKSYWGGGFVYHGIFSNRENDAGGIAIAHSRFSDYYQSQFSMDKLQSETALEISYEFVFSNPLVLKPNVQYIINPGTNTSIPNALMALVRMSYSW